VIEIVASNPDWPRLFEEERVSLLPLIGQYVEDIQHTGSTSVLRLAARPVIDILIAVRALALVEKCVGPLEWAHKKEVKVDAFVEITISSGVDPVLGFSRTWILLANLEV
jgi:GrpB-like predicted nucleotidyltransferase (UPF0157 family)